jgi:hypothetical protein
MYTQTYSTSSVHHTYDWCSAKKICKNLAEKKEKQIILLKIVEIELSWVISTNTQIQGVSTLHTYSSIVEILKNAIWNCFEPHFLN